MSEKTLVNILEKRNVASLKIMDVDIQEYYLANHFLILNSDVKLKRGVTEMRSVDDVSNVWLTGVTFNYLDYLIDGDAYIERLISTGPKEQSFVIKTKDLPYANGIIEDYINKKKYPVVVVNKDDINFTTVNGIFNYNLKSGVKLNVLFDNVQSLKGKVVPTTVEQERIKNKNGNSVVVKKVKEFLKDNSLDEYNLSRYNEIIK